MLDHAPEPTLGKKVVAHTTALVCTTGFSLGMNAGVINYFPATQKALTYLVDHLGHLTMNTVAGTLSTAGVRILNSMPSSDLSRRWKAISTFAGGFIATNVHYEICKALDYEPTYLELAAVQTMGSYGTAVALERGGAFIVGKSKQALQSCGFFAAKGPDERTALAPGNAPGNGEPLPQQPLPPLQPGVNVLPSGLRVIVPAPAGEKRSSSEDTEFAPGQHLLDGQPPAAGFVEVQEGDDVEAMIHRGGFANGPG